MWLLYWRSMFCVFSHTGHAFIGTDQPRLPAYLSLEIRIYTQARAWTVVEFEFSSAAPQAKPKVNDVRYNRWRCTTERHTQKKRNLGLWDTVGSTCTQMRCLVTDSVFCRLFHSICSFSVALGPSYSSPANLSSPSNACERERLRA